MRSVRKESLMLTITKNNNIIRNKNNDYNTNSDKNKHNLTTIV